MIFIEVIPGQNLFELINQPPLQTLKGLLSKPEYIFLRFHFIFNSTCLYIYLCAYSINLLLLTLSTHDNNLWKND